MSAQKKPVLTLTRKASTALVKYQLITALGAIATAGEKAFGAVTVDAETGDDIAVDVLGSTVVIAGAAVADGAEVEVGTDGKVITATTGKVVGVALQAAAANEAFEILIRG